MKNFTLNLVGVVMCIQIYTYYVHIGRTNIVFLVYLRYDWKLCSFLLDYLMFEIVQLDHISKESKA